MAKEPPYRVKNMMPGMIMLWNGSIGTIPSGWHLCDGTAGTPDLRDKFIIGAGLFYPPLDSNTTNVATDSGVAYTALCFIMKLPIP